MKLTITSYESELYAGRLNTQCLVIARIRIYIGAQRPANRAKYETIRPNS